MTNSNSEDDKEPISALAIATINIGCLIAYMIIVFSSGMSDTIAACVLFLHTIICIAFAVFSKRPVWWILACIVALPLLSLLTS